MGGGGGQLPIEDITSTCGTSQPKTEEIRRSSPRAGPARPKTPRPATTGVLAPCPPPRRPASFASSPRFPASRRPHPLSSTIRPPGSSDRGRPLAFSVVLVLSSASSDAGTWPGAGAGRAGPGRRAGWRAGRFRLSGEGPQDVGVCLSHPKMLWPPQDVGVSRAEPLYLPLVQGLVLPTLEGGWQGRHRLAGHRHQAGGVRRPCSPRPLPSLCCLPSCAP